MSFELDTLNGGAIRAGFLADNSVVELGKLPPMLTQQFVGYAATTLTEGVIPKLEPEAREDWAERFHSLREVVEGEATRVDILDPERLILVRETGVTTYRENPFWAHTDGQSVAFVDRSKMRILGLRDRVRHVVATRAFMYLAWRNVSGGVFGWSERGAYQEVKNAAVQIDVALNP